MTSNIPVRVKCFLFILSATLTVFCPLSCYARAFACATQPFDTVKFLQTVDDHILSLREKNIPKAYYKYTNSEFQRNTSLEDFTEIVSRHSPLFDNQSIILSSLQFYEEVGQYTGVITSKNGETLMIEYELTRSDKEWKILGFKLMHYVCDQEGENPRRGKSTASS